jgi:ferrous iron transport protein B
MARAAFLMDRLMSRCGLSGKSFIPLLSSLACAVPGIMATRVIEDRRDRLVTILVAPLMSCSARLPVYTLMIGAFLTAGYSWWVPGAAMFAMYAIGLVAAPAVALALKGTILRGKAPVFVMEMPAYKWPTLRGVVRRVGDAAGAFLMRAGTIILASAVVVWVLLNYPAGTYPQQIAELEARYPEERERAKELQDKIDGDLYRDNEPEAGDQKEFEALREKLDPVDDEVNRLRLEWARGSVLGTVGRAMEPVVRPLGWDWRVGVSVLASFPAREVVVSALGILYQQGQAGSDEVLKGEAREAREAARSKSKGPPEKGLGAEMRKGGLTAAGAVSLMVFFALCAQCLSTLAVIRRETGSWVWPVFSFAYMTILAYVAALIVFQVGSALGG